MGIFYTEGVVRRGMTLQRFAEVTSTNAARILGLYPRKGVIAAGQRRRHCPDRPVNQEDAHARGLPRKRLQPVGGMAGRGVAGHDNIARQGDR